MEPTELEAMELERTASVAGYIYKSLRVILDYGIGTICPSSSVPNRSPFHFKPIAQNGTSCCDAPIVHVAFNAPGNCDRRIVSDHDFSLIIGACGLRDTAGQIARP